MTMNSHTPAPTPTPLCAVFEPQVALLSSGMLEADEAAVVHEHLATCAYCQLQLHEYQRLREDVLRLLLGSEEISGHAHSSQGSQGAQRALNGATGSPALDRPAYFTLADIMHASVEQPPEVDEWRQAPRPPAAHRERRLLTSLGAIAAVLVLAVLTAAIFSSFLGSRSPATGPTPTATIQRPFVPYSAAAPGLPCDTNPQASTLWSEDQGTCLSNPPGTRLVAQGHLLAVMRWDAGTYSLPGSYKISVQVTLEGATTAKLQMDDDSRSIGHVIACSPNHCNLDGQPKEACACDTSRPLQLTISVNGSNERFSVGSTLLGSVTEASPLHPDSIGLGVTAADPSAQGGQAVFANFTVTAT